MTIRTTPDGDSTRIDAYCSVLRVIHDEIHSGALANIEGIASTKYRRDPRGTDLNCKLSSLQGPAEDPVRSQIGDETTPSSALISAMVSVTAGLAALLLAVI